MPRQRAPRAWSHAPMRSPPMKMKGHPAVFPSMCHHHANAMNSRAAASIRHPPSAPPHTLRLDCNAQISAKTACAGQAGCRHYHAAEAAAASCVQQAPQPSRANVRSSLLGSSLASAYLTSTSCKEARRGCARGAEQRASASAKRKAREMQASRQAPTARAHSYAAHRVGARRGCAARGVKTTRDWWAADDPWLHLPPRHQL